jgi:hypothetical protein
VNNPFFITGPAVISFSGGRTSAYMLWRILQAHGGRLPDDVVACFANTGREMPATLDFVAECGARWGVDIHWVEYRREERPGKRARIYADRVSHNSASRNGEPFDMLLSGKGIVPDPFRRFCTVDLKIKTIQRYVASEFGWKRSARVVGLRADESARVERLHKGQAALPSPDIIFTPLADAGIQTMDLRLHSKDGGNCDGCFMKSSDMLGRMFRREPERMRWWVEKEKIGKGKTFVNGRSYAEIERAAHAQTVLPWDDGAPCTEACGA